MTSSPGCAPRSGVRSAACQPPWWSRAKLAWARRGWSWSWRGRPRWPARSSWSAAAWTSAATRCRTRHWPRRYGRFRWCSTRTSWQACSTAPAASSPDWCQSWVSQPPVEARLRRHGSSSCCWESCTVWRTAGRSCWWSRTCTGPIGLPVTCSRSWSATCGGVSCCCSPFDRMNYTAAIRCVRSWRSWSAAVARSASTCGGSPATS
jgi:hypothetical protein